MSEYLEQTLNKALEMALSLEEGEIIRIFQEDHIWWYREMDTRPAKEKVISYTNFIRAGQLDPEDTYKHGLSLLSEEESYELEIIFNDAGLDKKCPILQLTLLGYIDSIVYALKRHINSGFPTKYKDYV